MSEPDKFFLIETIRNEGESERTWLVADVGGPFNALLATPARRHADELAEALREAVEKLQHVKQITGLGFPSFQSRAGELLSKLEDKP